MAKEIINEDFDVPEHFKEEEEDTGVEIEVVDDTPEEDRGRTRFEPDADHEDEVENYSKKVQKRIDQLSHRMNDERREKERLAREHAEALRIAQTFHNRVQQLENTLTWGQQEYTKEAQDRIDISHKMAQDKYKRAFESGDTDGVLEAQGELFELANQKNQLHNLAPIVQPQPFANVPLQQDNTPVYNQPTAPAPQPRDYKAEDWATRNPWFGKDEEMTAFAYGLHEKLVNSGVDPTSDDYYHKVDSRLREIFPKNFERSKKSSPVASVGRTTAPKKVTLNSSEVAIAKRLGVPLETYARYKSKGDTVNG